jgi:ankyrin repeat protein
MENPKVDINACGENDMTPLHVACSIKIPSEIVGMLLSDPRLRDVNALDVLENTPLHHACNDVNLEAVKLLLADKRVNVNPVERTNQTPFMCACKSGCRDLVGFLLSDERVEVNYKGLFQCMYVVFSGCCGAVVG